MENFVIIVIVLTVQITYNMKKRGPLLLNHVWTEILWLSIQRLVCTLVIPCEGRYNENTLNIKLLLNTSYQKTEKYCGTRMKKLALSSLFCTNKCRDQHFTERVRNLFL